MREIEELAKPSVTKLLLGVPFLLTTMDQRFLAAFLCLVSMRIEASGTMRAIPIEDRDYLRRYREPSSSWWIAITRYQDERDPHEYWSALFGMQRKRLDDPSPVGSEHCNTQVTSIICGKLFAHLHSTTIGDGFRGYEGADMTQIWPAHGFDLSTGFMRWADTAGVTIVHEAVAREGAPPDGIE